MHTEGAAPGELAALQAGMSIDGSASILTLPHFDFLPRSTCAIRGLS